MEGKQWKGISQRIYELVVLSSSQKQ